MRKFLLLLFAFISNFGYSLNAQNNCDADTTIFYLPQNEYNSGRAWFYSPNEEQEQWSGGLDLYDMYDPCVAKNNTIIITEANIAAGNYGTYMELTNVGNEAVDLSDYRLIGQRNDTNYPSLKVSRMSHLDLSGILEPGESYIIMGYSKYKNTVKGVMDRADSLTQHNPKLAAIADIKYSIDTQSGKYPFLVGRGYDILGTSWNYNFSLAKIIGDTSEVIVDVFEQLYAEKATATIAGVPYAASNYTVVRKQFTNGRTYGSTDFKLSSGAEAAEASEWMLVPRFRNGTSHLPTTIGSHTPNTSFALSAIVESGAIIDEAENTIYLPWGTYNGDSILSFLAVGENMSWAYQKGNILEDAVSNLVHTGDTITFYHCGTDITSKSYHIEVLAPTDDIAKVFCLKRQSDLSQMYYETQGLAVDTIYGNRLTFDYPVDTLLSYIESIDTSAFEIVFKDGELPRPTLKTGDILRAKAKNGNTHDYYIALIPYEQNILSHDARLNTITWPEYPKDEIDPYLWNTGDTIPGFNKDGYTYIITLPFGTEKVPALQAVSFNPRASVNCIPATDLFGTNTDKTTRFVVTAEDDSTVTEYAVLFLVESEDWDYEGEPFFSEYTGNNNFSAMMEICNPGNVALDMSDYVIVHGKYNKKTLPQVFEWDTDGYFDNAKVYRPGYVYDSLTMVSNQQYWFDPNGDSDVDSYVEAGGVFTIGATGAGGTSRYGYYDPNTGKWQTWAENGIIEGPNVILHGASGSLGWSWNKHGANAYGLMGRIIYSSGKYTAQCNTFWLLKILNDSIKDGTKGLNDAMDFEVIDVIGKIENGETFGWLNAATGKPITLTPKGAYIRKPQYYKGNTVSMGSLGYGGIETTGTYDKENPVLGDTATLEWNFTENVAYNYDMGRHTLNPVTEFKSTVSSTIYAISLGISMDETIDGVSNNTAVSDFINNIIKTDAGQTVQMASAGGALMFDFDILQEGDKLTVTSADGKNQTAYTIHIGELSSDVTISSETYDITDTAVMLNAVNVTLKEMLANIATNEKSILYIVDDKGGLVANTRFSLRDSSYFDAPVTGNLNIKVIAQNGDTKLYTIVLPSNSTDTYITSGLYEVDNGLKQINGVYNGSNVDILLDNITPCEGATVSVLNKWGQLKAFGVLLFDDVVRVVSADGTQHVYYGITLNSEVEPEVTLAVTDNTIKQAAKAYPNPTTGKVSFENKFESAEVIDITGKLVKQVNNAGYHIDLSNLPMGMYIITVTDITHNVSTVKITKQ